jgi:hypothetical protein
MTVYVLFETFATSCSFGSEGVIDIYDNQEDALAEAKKRNAADLYGSIFSVRKYDVRTSN